MVTKETEAARHLIISRKLGTELKSADVGRFVGCNWFPPNSSFLPPHEPKIHVGPNQLAGFQSIQNSWLQLGNTWQNFPICALSFPLLGYSNWVPKILKPNWQPGPTPVFWYGFDPHTHLQDFCPKGAGYLACAGPPLARLE